MITIIILLIVLIIDIFTYMSMEIDKNNKQYTIIIEINIAC